MNAAYNSQAIPASFKKGTIRMQLSRYVWLPLCLILTLNINFAFFQASASEPLYQVQFTNCIESIGVGLAPTNGVLAMVPPEFIPVGIGEPVTPIVARTARCVISVDGLKKRVGNIVQIGAIIVPPDGTGDINNYTLYYYTDDIVLWLYMHLSGIDAQFVPTMQYVLTQNKSLLVQVPLPGNPRVRITGNVTPSNSPSGSFLANWWQKTACGVVKMSTNVPVIKIGGADLSLTTSSASGLGQLIGGNTLGFPIIQQFNLFDQATMTVEQR